MQTTPVLPHQPCQNHVFMALMLYTGHHAGTSLGLLVPVKENLNAAEYKGIVCFQFWGKSLGINHICLYGVFHLIPVHSVGTVVH